MLAIPLIPCYTVTMTVSRSYLIIDRNSKFTLKPNPDHLIVGPKKSGSIGIEAIRELKAWAALKPFLSKQKIALIKEAQTLTIEAQNAMLKLLEEPPKRTIIILTVNDQKNLLPTIVSRCQLISGERMCRESSSHQTLLSALGGLQRLSESDPELVEGVDELRFASKRIDTPRAVLSKDSALADRRWPLPESMSLSLSEKFQLAEKFSKQGRGEVVKILDGWIINLREQLLSSKKPEIARLLRKIERSRQAIQKNANVRLALENLMLEIPE